MGVRASIPFVTARLKPLALFGPDPARARGSATAGVPHAPISRYV